MIFKTARLLTPLFLILFLTNAFAQSDILTDADQMPYFSGCQGKEKDTDEKRNCSNKNLVWFISNSLVYPSEAKKSEIEGTVYVSFIIDEEGKVIRPEVIRDIGFGCGTAAIDVIKSMPAWEPAVHQGQKVKVKLNVPIHFSLKNDGANEKAQNYQINWGSLSTQTSTTKAELEAQFDKKLYVRDPFGNEKPITELIFSYEKKRTYLEAGSAGSISTDLKKIVGKCKKGGVFTIIAVVQVKGESLYVRHSFKVL